VLLSGIKGYISLTLDPMDPLVIAAVTRRSIQIQDICRYVNQTTLWQVFGVALLGQALAAS